MKNQASFKIEKAEDGKLMLVQIYDAKCHAEPLKFKNNQRSGMKCSGHQTKDWDLLYKWHRKFRSPNER